MATVKKLIHALKGILSLSNESLTMAIELPGLGNTAIEAAIDKGEHPMSQVSIGSYQLIVIAANELTPGKIGVTSLRHIYRQ
jgi:hypothetical protein